MASLRIGSIAGALATALLLAPLTSAAETKAWDQAAVAKLGADLAKACIALYNEYYAEQGINPKIGSGDAADSFRLRHKLQRLEEESEGLAGGLAGGKGRDATITRVENIGVLSRDLRVLLARMFVMAPLQQRVDAAWAIWLQILPYYGIDPPAGASPTGS
jgi:hypothetical protein